MKFGRNILRHYSKIRVCKPAELEVGFVGIYGFGIKYRIYTEHASTTCSLNRKKPLLIYSSTIRHMPISAFIILKNMLNSKKKYSSWCVFVPPKTTDHVNSTHNYLKF